MLDKRDIEFANRLNIILKNIEKENQMPNCNFLMKCKILEAHKSIKEDFIEYKKTDMQEWIYKDSFDGTYTISNEVPVLLKYFENGINLEEISYEALLYSPLDNREPCSLDYFTTWFYTNDFDINNPDSTCNLIGINSKRKDVLQLIKNYFETESLSYYKIVDEPNELSSGNFISHSSHFFICSNDRILMFEFEMYS